jgi:predicted nucleic acid-binding protein
VRDLLGRVSLIELAPTVLVRALEPFPLLLRTLDALHLASMQFLRTRGQAVELASYDERLVEAASALGIKVFAV